MFSLQLVGRCLFQHFFFFSKILRLRPVSFRLRPQNVKRLEGGQSLGDMSPIDYWRLPSYFVSVWEIRTSFRCIELDRANLPSCASGGVNRTAEFEPKMWYARSLEQSWSLSSVSRYCYIYEYIGFFLKFLYSCNTENYSKKPGFRCNKSRHCAYIKTLFFKTDMLPYRCIPCVSWKRFPQLPVYFGIYSVD